MKAPVGDGVFLKTGLSKKWKAVPKNGNGFRSKGKSQMRREIAIIAGPRDWGQTHESWLNRVPERVKTVSHRTVKALWYGEIKDPEHWAARDIRRAVELIEAQREAASLARQLETIVTGLNVSDPDFHKPSIAALVSALRNLRGPDRT